MCILEFSGNCVFALNKTTTSQSSYLINKVSCRQEIYFIKELFKWVKLLCVHCVLVNQFLYIKWGRLFIYSPWNTLLQKHWEKKGLILLLEVIPKTNFSKKIPKKTFCNRHFSLLYLKRLTPTCSILLHCFNTQENVSAVYNFSYHEISSPRSR